VAIRIPKTQQDIDQMVQQARASGSDPADAARRAQEALKKAIEDARSNIRNDRSDNLDRKFPTQSNTQPLDPQARYEFAKSVQNMTAELEDLAKATKSVVDEERRRVAEQKRLDDERKAYDKAGKDNLVNSSARAFGGATGNVIATGYSQGKVLADPKSTMLGKLGAVVAIADAAGSAAAESIHKFNDGVVSAGEAAKKIASNDGFGALNVAVDATARGLEGIPIIGKTLGESLKTVTTGLNVFNSVLGAFAERGRELGKYNGTIATAAALADVEKLMADIREGNRASKEYAELIRAQTKVEVNMQEALLPIKLAIMRWLEPLAKDMAILIKIMGGSYGFDGAGGAVKEQSSGIMKGLGFLGGLIGVNTGTIKKGIRDIIKEMEKDNGLNTVYKDLFNGPEFAVPDATPNPVAGGGRAGGLPFFPNKR